MNLQIIVAANSNRNVDLHKINNLIPKLSRITLLNIHKVGKANAINEALRYVKNEVVLIGDADTLFVSHGVNRCIERIYSDKRIIAITGIIDPISNSLLAAIQKFEYRRIFRVFKPFWELYHANLIVSGCAGIFRTDALFRVGLYDCQTLGEDFEITLRLHEYYLRNKIPYKVEYINQLVAKTDVPSTFQTLTKQRGRWFVGQLEVLWKYRFFLIHPFRYRTVAIPYVLSLLFEILMTFLKLVFVIAGIVFNVLSKSNYLKGWLITELGFILFEILLNLCMKKRIKAKKSGFIIRMTCMLLIMQFLLKNTNLLYVLKNKKSKENRW